MAAQITGLKPEQIHVHTTFLGGGFGRRFERDFVEEALLLSLSTGKPVKLVWKREEDIQNDFYRPMNASRIQGVARRRGPRHLPGRTRSSARPSLPACSRR